ncbi:hypothetical protein GOBAR_AA18297 [Gossypium barbadense]|uniref:RRM domain-containing protein n=1 Tax=Gossypium barbadense TaxID=3634 RepID=A0A2P5XGA5_GOSBA|nr:hypothetical protein GOBAR_AA18297 [Gossypium barbadense]
MSHFGRSGPPDISDTYSLLVLNITFRTTADDLFPLFDKYGKVVDIFIPKDRRTGDSRGFAFVRYKYADEAQKAVDRLDGRVVDDREITVQFAKYGPNAERICTISFAVTKEGLLNQFQGQEVTAHAEGTGMIIPEIGIIGEEVVVGAMTGMNVIDIVGKTETIGVAAGVVVQVLTILKVEEEGAMMMIGGVAVDHRVLLLLAAALVLVGVLPHARPLLQGVKVLTGAAVMEGLQVLEVFHHEATLLILVVHLLGTQMLMNNLADGLLETLSSTYLVAMLVLRTFIYLVFSSIGRTGFLVF